MKLSRYGETEDYWVTEGLRDALENNMQNKGNIVFYEDKEGKKPAMVIEGENKTYAIRIKK